MGCSVTVAQLVLVQLVWRFESFRPSHLTKREEYDIMTLQRLVAQKIYEFRMELDINGSEKHDWWLADQFLQKIGDDMFDDNDIYSWFIQLDENLVPRQNMEE